MFLYMSYPEIEISKDDLRKLVYFILMKFRGDPLHRQGTSAKRDFIGGYIERWFNKIAETVIFDELLKNKNYRVVSDYFVYANDSEKNAPDILGLENEKVIPFVKYNNGSWKSVEGMPRIEVKVVRKDQSLVAVREPQMIDDFYAFIESNLELDYLTAIFDEMTFDNKYFEELKMSEDFIESDIDNQIIQHVKISKSVRVGTMRLIGIYTKSELRENSTVCGRGVHPYYFSNAINKSPRSRIRLNERINLDDKSRFVYKFDNSYTCLPVAIENPNNGDVVIIKKNKGSLYINSSDKLIIGGVEVDMGDIAIEFKKFERSSNWDENILLKQTLETFGTDYSLELVKLFDDIVNGI